jgi:type IV pilus assembly protein PilE
MKKIPLGFSLIELLIALAIIATLSTWAWPNYQLTVMRSQRVQARNGLMLLAHWLERSAASSGKYPDSKTIPCGLLQTQGGHYLLQVQVQADAQTYLLKAVPQQQQVLDACGSFTLNHLGERGVQNASQSSLQCWSR